MKAPLQRATPMAAPARPSRLLTNRCGCQQHNGPSGGCAECQKKRLAANHAGAAYAFGNVRVHANAEGDLLANAGGQVVNQAAAGGGAPFPCAPGQQPGAERSVDVQPVFFKDSATDAHPTGASWSRRIASANAVWGKLGVTFNALSSVEVVDAARKTASGATLADFNNIRAAHSGAGIEVFMVENDMSSRGGGGTINSGSASAQIVLSDLGTSDTLLAHELGHVLGLGHPPASDANTVMEPTGSNNTANTTRNTLANFNLITFPAAGNPVCIHPDA